MMMNKVFKIGLEAEGAPDVESFSSYIYRAAFEHGVSIGKFIRYLVEIDEGRIINSESKNFSRSIGSDTLVRPNESSVAILKIMEELTENKLTDGMLWFMKDKTKKCGMDVINGFRWCPECLKEMEDINATPYFKLIWHLRDIDKCHVHRTPLVCVCQYCGSPQTMAWRKYPIGFCGECGKPLSKRKHELSPGDISRSNYMSGIDVAKLFKDIFHFPEMEIGMDQARKSMIYLMDNHKRQLKESGVFEMVSMGSISNFVDSNRENHSISIKNIRRISYAMGISLFDFLSGNAYRYPKPLVCGVEKTKLPDFMHVKSREKIDHDLVKEGLLKINQVKDNPVSLKEAARVLDVSVGYLEYRYPNMVREIVNRFSAHREQLKIYKRYKAQEAALRYFTHEKYKFQNKSRKQAYRVLREETGLPKFVLKDAIQSVYTSIY